MKKSISVLFLSFLFASTLVFAEKAPPESKYSYEYRETASQMQMPLPPYEKDGFIIFSAKDGPRHVGIAFDFEDYQVIHSFQKKTTYDIDENPSNSWYFFILEPPEGKREISYRMIIDGLWTTDPLNQVQVYDIDTGIHLSKYKIQKPEEIVTKPVEHKGVHFIYEGQSGQKVRLSGTFTGWDSWIYEMKETSRGFYELYVPLPDGTYYYSYFIGTKSVPDKSNPDRVYSTDGDVVSRLIVRQ